MIQCRRGTVAESGDGSLTLTLRIPAQHAADFLSAWPDPTQTKNVVVAPVFGLVQDHAEIAPRAETAAATDAAAVLRGDAPAPKPPARTIGAASAGAQGKDPMATAGGRMDAEKAIAPLLRHPPFQQWIMAREVAHGFEADPFLGPMQRVREYIMRNCVQLKDGAKVLGEAFVHLVKEYQAQGGSLPHGDPPKAAPAHVPGAEFDVRVVDQD